MTQAKVPGMDGHWEYIDIFLFTNGQQYSPPRKYHLRADELNSWDATLSRIARSQFGSMHTAIELYTLDGHRVEGPLELRNEMAYVAVEPPDIFVDAGYDKYLIKASRSWEKRRAKKTNSAEIPPDAVLITYVDNNTDGDCKKYPNSGEDFECTTDCKAYEITSIKLPEESFTVESLINPPVTSVTETQQPVAAPAPALKQIDGKRTSLPQRVTTFKKVANPNSSVPPIKKIPLKTKESPSKKYTKPLIRPAPANLGAKSKLNTKSGFKSKTNIPDGASKVSEKEDKRSLSLAKLLSSDHKNLLTDSAPIENVIEDKENILVSNLVPNPENEVSAVKIDNVVKKEQSGVQYSPEIIRIAEEIQSVLDNTQGQIREERRRSSKIKIVNATPDSNSIILANNNVDDNYIAFIKKGDVVNLKLMIEVRNVDNQNVKYKPIRRSQSILNILKNDKVSQNFEDEVLIQSKSLQSVIQNRQSLNAEGPKLLVVNYDCREVDDNDRFHASESSVYTNNKRYFVLLPISGEDSDRCECNGNIKNTKESNSTQKNQQFRSSSIIHPVKQTYSEISIERINKGNSRRRDIDTPIHNSISSQIQSPANTDQGNEYVATKENLIVTEGRILNPDVNAPRRSSQVERTEYIVRRKSSVKETSNVVDNSTQTRTSDILLEARRHEDGRYTFHLPPLHLLKHYQL